MSTNYSCKAFSSMVLQGSVMSDSILGVSTPGLRSNRGGVYYYANLNSIEPQVVPPNRDAQLGLTRAPTASINPISNNILQNVPDIMEALYGELGGGKGGNKASTHWCHQ